MKVKFSERAVVVTVPAAAGLLVLCLIVVSRFNGLYGQDAHEYLRLARELKNFPVGGAPVTQQYFPLLYPFTAACLSRFIPNDIAVMQMVSVVAFVLAMACFIRLLQLLYGYSPQIGLYTWLICCLSPYVMRFGMVSMSDMLCLLFVIAGFYFTFLAQKVFCSRYFLPAVFFCSAAVATRYLAVWVMLPAAGMLAALAVNKTSKAPVTVIAALLIAVLPLLPDLLLTHRLLFISLDGGIHFGYGSDAYQWSLKNFFEHSFSSNDGQQFYAQWNIVFVCFNLIHPAFLFPGIFLLFFVSKKDFERAEIRWLVSAVIVYALYLAGLRYQNMRYLLLTFPLIAIVLFPAFNRALQWLGTKNIRWPLAGLAISIVQLGLFVFSFQKIYLLNQTEKELAASIKQLNAPVVLTTDVTGALHSYGVSLPVIDLYDTMVNSVPENALLLFNQPEFSAHFANRLPMMNYELLRTKYDCLVVDSFKLGWKLYRIKQKEP